MAHFIDKDFYVYDENVSTILNRNLSEFVAKGLNIYNESKNWNIPDKFNLLNFVESLNPNTFAFITPHFVVVECDAYYATINVASTLTIDIHGSPNVVKSFIKDMDNKFHPVKESASITWFYNDDMHYLNLPLKTKPTYDSFYPFLNFSRHEYYQRYLDSDSNILILLGEPGTGKTNFLKDLMVYSKSEVYLTYSEKLMQNDSFFVRFINSGARFLVFEDADTYMSARSDGNYMMHRFLNVAEGLVSSKNKKIIFTTNLPSVQRVDEALLRKGRCFDLLNFRRYSESEAQQICKDIGRPMPSDRQYPITLANLLND